MQPHVPIWVGGRTYRSLRRAVELGDGWAPFGLRTAELATMLQRARDTEAWSARTNPLDVILQNEHPLDPLAEPERVAEQLARFADIGATGVNVRFVHHSPTHYREQLAALAIIAANGPKKPKTRVSHQQMPGPPRHRRPTDGRETSPQDPRFNRWARNRPPGPNFGANSWGGWG